MTVKEAIKLLTEKGFVQLNQVGSHKKFGKDNKRITIVFHRSYKEELSRKAKKDLLKLLEDE